MTKAEIKRELLKEYKQYLNKLDFNQLNTIFSCRTGKFILEEIEKENDNG